MNIFILDKDIKQNAKYHVDKHVRKQLLESVQILQNAYYVTSQEHLATYKKTHIGNRFCKWATESIENWLWLRDFAFELYVEYEHRFEKPHKSGELLLTMEIPNLPNIERTDFAFNVGKVTPTKCVVDDYRKYYNTEKQHMYQWTNREIPKWAILNQ